MESLEEKILASGKYDVSHRIVGVRAGTCPKDEGIHHILKLKLGEGREIEASDLAALIDAGGVYWMIPPPGAPAYEAHLATGLPLILQTRHCPGCGLHVPFA